MRRKEAIPWIQTARKTNRILWLNRGGDFNPFYREPWRGVSKIYRILLPEQKQSNKQTACIIIISHVLLCHWEHYPISPNDGSYVTLHLVKAFTVSCPLLKTSLHSLISREVVIVVFDKASVRIVLPNQQLTCASDKTPPEVVSGVRYMLVAI